MSTLVSVVIRKLFADKTPAKNIERQSNIQKLTKLLVSTGKGRFAVVNDAQFIHDCKQGAKCQYELTYKWTDGETQKQGIATFDKAHIDELVSYVKLDNELSKKLEAIESEIAKNQANIDKLIVKTGEFPRKGRKVSETEESEENEL